MRIWTRLGSSCGPPRTHSGSETEWQRLGTQSMRASARRTPSRQPGSAVVWKGEHSQAPAHLEKVGGEDGRKAAAQLRRLLPLKNRAEYDPDPISESEAKAAVIAAARMVRIAEPAVGRSTAEQGRQTADGKTPDLRNGQRYNATDSLVMATQLKTLAVLHVAARPCCCEGTPCCTLLHGVARTPSDSVVEDAPTLSIFAGTVLSLVA